MKRIVNLLIVLGIIGMFGVAFIPESVAAMTGSGTEGDPYMIYDVDDLQDMSLNLTAYYELANAIDASVTSTWNGGAGFEPVGTIASPFEGTLEGAGYTINNLFINRPGEDSTGLFGSVTGIIKNIGLTNVDIIGDNYVGGLTGELQSGGNIDNSYGTGTIIGGNNFVGGLVGSASAGIISDSHFSGNVIGSGYQVGGLVGVASNGGAVSNSYSTGTVCGVHRIGGLIGQNSAVTIDTSYSTVNVTATGVGVGGLIGYALYASVSNCYARGNVFGDSCVGGLVGELLSGYTISNSYSTGAVTGNTDIGGLVGYSTGIVTYSFWDVETSGQATSDGGTGKTTVQMKTESTYTGWDFDTIWAISSLINSGYPYLLWGYTPITSDINQVVWFQPNYIIQGTELPNRTGEEDGVIHWGANPAGITISNGELIPEEEYDFEPIIPGSTDIIKPEPGSMVGDVDLERLHDNPLYPLVQVLTIPGFLTERLVWLGLAWLIVIGAMLGVHLGFDTHKDTEKPQHFILTTIAGLGLSIIFYTMGIFPLWVVILMAFGLVGAIIWERQPVI